jgi:hypothetical protein
MRAIIVVIKYTARRIFFENNIDWYKNVPINITVLTYGIRIILVLQIGATVSILIQLDFDFFTAYFIFPFKAI